jgi:hypothetical protein
MVSAIVSTIYLIVVFPAFIALCLGFLTFGISKEDRELIKNLQSQGQT